MSQVLFATADLLPKDLRFEHGGAKLATCPGRHQTALRPCSCPAMLHGINLLLDVLSFTEKSSKQSKTSRHCAIPM